MTLMKSFKSFLFSKALALAAPLFALITVFSNPAHADAWRGFQNFVGNVRGGLNYGINSIIGGVNNVINTVGSVFDMLGLGWLFNKLMNKLFGIGTCGEVMSNGVGRVICNVVLSSQMLPGLISAIAYMIGLILAVTAVVKLKDHVTDPRTPLSDSLKRFVAGGMFLSLPVVINAVMETVTGYGRDELDLYDQTGFAGQLSGGYGLDSMLYILVADIWEPLHYLLNGFAYLAGLVFVMIGIGRLLKTAQEGPRGPTGVGTIMTFITAGILFSLNQIMGAFSESLFASSTIATYGQMSQTTGDFFVDGHIDAVVASVIGFMTLVGWISFIRGFFILREVAEGGQQASLMAAGSHIFGGALAVNLGPLLNAVQSTFGLTGFGIIFS
jgi:hypothetical protein